MRFMGFGFMTFGASICEHLLLGSRFFSDLFTLLLTHGWGPLVILSGWCVAAPRRWQPSPDWSPVPLGLQELMEESRSTRIAAKIFGVGWMLIGVGAIVYFNSDAFLVGKP